MHFVHTKFCSHSRIPSLPISSSSCCLGGSEDHQPGGHLHAGGLQHAPSRHHLQQLHRRTPSGRPLIFFSFFPSHFLLPLKETRVCLSDMPDDRPISSFLCRSSTAPRTASVSSTSPRARSMARPSAASSPKTTRSAR